MPKYSFACDNCDFTEIKYLSIDEFIKIKKQKNKCEKCLDGVLSHLVGSINAVIERSNDQVEMGMKEDIRKILDKVSIGNRRIIEDIYGDRPNPYKK